MFRSVFGAVIDIDRKSGEGGNERVSLVDGCQEITNENTENRLSEGMM